ncbi:anti-lipopolysaccharide factor-like isoform X2 [Cherax quadricarinatus]
MAVRVVLSVMMAMMLMVSFLPASDAQGWETLALAVAQKAISLWRNDEVEFMGHNCNISVSPYIKRFQLYYRGRMSCPGWTHIRGEGDTRSKSGVAGKTTQDFVNKAFASGLISQQDAQKWLQS